MSEPDARGARYARTVGTKASTIQSSLSGTWPLLLRFKGWAECDQRFLAGCGFESCVGEELGDVGKLASHDWRQREGCAGCRTSISAQRFASRDRACRKPLLRRRSVSSRKDTSRI